MLFLLLLTLKFTQDAKLEMDWLAFPNLVEVTKKWGVKFIRYARLLSLFNMEDWLIPLSFFKAWITECQIIGRYLLNYVYVRCDDKIVRIRTAELLTHFKTVKAVEEEAREIEQIIALDSRELGKIVNDLPAVLVDVSKSPSCSIPGFAVFGDDVIYLMGLEDASLYLNYVYINSTLEDSRFMIEISFLSQSDSGYVDVTYYVQGDGRIRYLGKASTKFAREVLLKATPHKGGKKEDELIEEGIATILSAVNEKYSIIDRMLASAEDVFIKGMKGLTAVLLY